MLKDLNLGRYYNTQSILHSLDPRTKLFFLIIYIVSLFLSNSVIGFVLDAATIIILIVLSKVPVKFIFKGFKTIFLIVIITDLINIFTVDNGIMIAIEATLRVFEIIMVSNILTLTTKPKDIADAIEKSLGFLKVIKVPVHDIATMITIAIRFIPILTTESQRILQSQKARGADFESKNLIQKAKSIVPILVPLFISAFRKADDLALAMDCRLYGATDNATRLHPLCYHRRDAFGYIVSILYLSLAIFMRFLWH